MLLNLCVLQIGTHIDKHWHTYPVELAVILSEYVITDYGNALRENIRDTKEDIYEVVRLQEQPQVFLERHFSRRYQGNVQPWPRRSMSSRTAPSEYIYRSNIVTQCYGDLLQNTCRLPDKFPSERTLSRPHSHREISSTISYNRGNWFMRSEYRYTLLRNCRNHQHIKIWTEPSARSSVISEGH